MRIYRTASLKNRIAQFAITDPHILLFVRKYGQLVPWGDLVPAKRHEGGREMAQHQINDVARGLVESRLRPMIDRMADNNVYVESVDLRSEAMRNADNPEIQAAIAQYNRDPAGAEKKVLDVINGDKETVFKDWFEYMDGMYMEEHGCFAFTVLSAVLKESDARRTNPPPPMNSNAIALVYEKVTGDDSNIMKEYSQAVVEASKGVRKSFADGWVMIPGKPKSEEDPEKWGEYEENLAVLRTYGSAGKWCIGGSEWSDKYLSMGDFHILVEDSTPVVAVRLVGDELAEIDGRGNNKDIVRDHWEEVIDFLHASDIDYEGNRQYEELKEFVEENEAMAMMSEDEMYNSVAGATPGVIAGYGRKMSRDNRARFAPALGRAVRYVLDEERKKYPDRSLISVGVESISKLPEEFRERKIRRPWGWMLISEMPDDRVVVTYYDGKPERIEWMEEIEVPSPEKAYGDLIENWIGYSRMYGDSESPLDAGLSAVKNVTNELAKLPDFLQSQVGAKELMAEISVEAVHLAMSRVTTAPVDWNECEDILRPVMGDYEWNVFSDGSLNHVDTLAMTESGSDLLEELRGKNDKEWGTRLTEAAMEAVYGNLESLISFSEGFLREYTPIEEYYESEKRRQEESDYPFDHEDCMETAASDMVEPLSEQAADEGKMHQLSSDSYMNSTDRGNGWNTTFEKNLDNPDVLLELIEDHPEKMEHLYTGTAEKIINKYPGFAYKVVSNLGSNVHYPLDISSEAIYEIWNEDPWNQISYVADLQNADWSGYDPEFVEQAVLPELGTEYLPELISSVGPEWNVPEEALDNYVDSTSNAVQELVETGNPYVIRYLRKTMSPAEADIYVNPQVGEEQEEAVRSIPEPYNPDQMRLDFATWLDWGMRKEADAKHDFWIDENGEPITTGWKTHHAMIVRKKILEDAGIPWEDRKRLSADLLMERGIRRDSDEWKALFGDFEDCYAIATRKWNWIRVVGQSGGDNPYVYVGDFGRDTIKRIALGFESLYGQEAYDFDYYIEEFSDSGEGRAGYADFWRLEKGEAPSSRRVGLACWIDRGLRKEAELGSQRLIAGLDYYVGEYADVIEGTVYEEWMLEGTVLPMRWERVSSNVIDIYVTLYMDLRHDSAEFMRSLRDNLIVPLGWSVQMTTPGEWKERDGKKYSVVRMEIERD